MVELYFYTTDAGNYSVKFWNTSNNIIWKEDSDNGSVGIFYPIGVTEGKSYTIGVDLSYAVSPTEVEWGVRYSSSINNERPGVLDY